MTLRFDGRVAIVTGAGGGLGRQHALALAARGAKVVVNDLGGTVDGTGGAPTAAQAVVDEIRAAGGEAMANGASVTDFAAVQAMVADAMQAWGRVDILVNNAGILRDKSFAKMELADFRLVLDVHLMGAVHCTQGGLADTMRAQNYGRIVMTTSSSGLYGNFGQSNYGAAKMALVGLMQTLAIEGAKHDIRVNCLAPTAATRMTEGLMPAGVLALLEPGAVTPAMLALVGEDAPTRDDPVRRRRLLRARPRDADARRVRRPARPMRRSRSRNASRRSPTGATRASRRAAAPRARSRSARRCALSAEPRRCVQARRTGSSGAADRAAAAGAGAAPRRGRRHAAAPGCDGSAAAPWSTTPRQPRGRRYRSPRSMGPSARRSSRRGRRRCRPTPAPRCRWRKSPARAPARRSRCPSPSARPPRSSGRPAPARRAGDRPGRSAVLAPSRRAASSGCGVRIVCWPRALACAQRRLQAAVGADGVEGIGVEQQAADHADQAAAATARHRLAAAAAADDGGCGEHRGRRVAPAAGETSARAGRHRCAASRRCRRRAARRRRGRRPRRARRGPRAARHRSSPARRRRRRRRRSCPCAAA